MSAWCWTPWESTWREVFLRIGEPWCWEDGNGSAYIPLLEACLDDDDDGRWSIVSLGLDDVEDVI